MKYLNLYSSIALATTIAALGTVREARAEEVVVPGREVSVTETRPDPARLGSGIFTLGVPYVASVIVAAGSDHPGDHNLYVPVAGPWMDFADRHCGGGASCDREGLDKGLLIVDGIFQGIGALQIVSAFVFPETVTVSAARRDVPPMVAHVDVGPAGVGTGYGVVAFGAF